MDRINGAGHVNNRFVSEDIATNRPPTEITPEIMNALQEELMAVIEGSGLAPDVKKNNQIATAIQSGKLCSSAAGGIADAITGNFTPVIGALIHGMCFYIRAASANVTTAPTFTPASGTIAAKTIVKGADVALTAGDIAGGGHWVELQYDLTLDKWVLLNPSTAVYSFGFGQTWQNVIANRSFGTTYYNTTPRPIMVVIRGNPVSGSTGFTATVNGVSVGGTSVAAGNTATLSFVVPPGGDYVVSNGSAIMSPLWSELR